MDFAKFLTTSILKNICERLLLKLVQISPGLPFLITYLTLLAHIGTYALVLYHNLQFRLPIPSSLLLMLL